MQSGLIQTLRFDILAFKAAAAAAAAAADEC
jgi:hypothetical protein